MLATVKKTYQKTKSKYKQGKEVAKTKAIKAAMIYRKHVVTAFLAAFAFVIALYLRDFIQEIINYILTIMNVSAGAGLVYKGIITLFVIALCVTGILIVSKWAVKK